MDNIVMLFACLATGMTLRWSRRAPENAHTTINAFIIHVSLPALTLVQVHAVHLDLTLLYAVLMPWLLFIASAALFWMVGRAFRLPPTTTGALMVVGGLGNTSRRAYRVLRSALDVLALVGLRGLAPVAKAAPESGPGTDGATEA